MSMQDRAYAAAIFVIIGICCIGAYVAISGFANANPGGLLLAFNGATASPTVGVTPWVGLWQVRGLVAQAAYLTPMSPHLQVVQRAINWRVLPPGMPATPPVSPHQPPSHQPSLPTQGGQPPSLNGSMPEIGRAHV